MSDAPQFIITIQRIIIKTHDILTSDSPIKTLFTCFPEVPKYINTALMLFFLSLFFFFICSETVHRLYCCWNKHGRWIVWEHLLTVLFPDYLKCSDTKSTQHSNNLSQSNTIPENTTKVGWFLPACGRLTWRLQGTEAVVKNVFWLVFILQYLWKKKNKQLSFDTEFLSTA